MDELKKNDDMIETMKNFIDWLNKEVQKKGWNYSELARRSELAPSTISMIISQQTNPGFDFCIKIARALKEPPEKVLRLAGLLPALPEDKTSLTEIYEIAAVLSPEERQRVLEYAAWRLSEQKSQYVVAPNEGAP